MHGDQVIMSLPSTFSIRLVQADDEVYLLLAICPFVLSMCCHNSSLVYRKLLNWWSVQYSGFKYHSVIIITFIFFSRLFSSWRQTVMFFTRFLLQSRLCACLFILNFTAIQLCFDLLIEFVIFDIQNESRATQFGSVWFIRLSYVELIMP